MLANPKTVVDRGFVRNLIDHTKQIQPNAIDWTADRIALLDDTSNRIVITETAKSFRNHIELPVSDDGLITLQPNSEFDIYSDVYVEVPEGYAALLILRSTFVRNGLILASGLYDSGFKGNIGAVLHTGNKTIAIGKGTRLGQIMFIASDSAGVYAGGYNTKDGEIWKDTHDKK